MSTREAPPPPGVLGPVTTGNVPATPGADSLSPVGGSPVHPAGGGDGPGGPAFPAGTDRHEPPDEAWPPGVPTDRSSYLQYLPAIYGRNDFMARYLLIFEAILSPIERTIANISDIFDPATAPSDILPWLGSWLGVVMDENWPEERRRDLIRNAAELYHWRGTRRGLTHYIHVATGFEPEIIEPTLSEISSSRGQAFRFTVRLRVPRGTRLDRPSIQRIIDAEKPAFAVGVLEVIFG
ncbi:MAG: phage tail protein I [Dehalococcoidia bacterium]|nr:phage tail protein I [Dehalococcoidia bacterium]